MDTNLDHREDGTEVTETVDSTRNEQEVSSTDTAPISSDAASDQDDSKKDFNKEALLSDLHKERSARKDLRAQVEQLTQAATEHKDVMAERDTLQTKYERLEAFLVAVGGPLGKALDSKSFTKDLFESDTSVEELVDAWNKNNPSHTSSALGATAGEGKSTTNINDLLRMASS